MCVIEAYKSPDEAQLVNTNAKVKSKKTRKNNFIKKSLLSEWKTIYQLK